MRAITHARDRSVARLQRLMCSDETCRCKILRRVGGVSVSGTGPYQAVIVQHKLWEDMRPRWQHCPDLCILALLQQHLQRLHTARHVALMQMSSL